MHTSLSAGLEVYSTNPNRCVLSEVTHMVGATTSLPSDGQQKYYDYDHCFDRCNIHQMAAVEQYNNNDNNNNNAKLVSL